MKALSKSPGVNWAFRLITSLAALGFFYRYAMRLLSVEAWIIVFLSLAVLFCLFLAYSIKNFHEHEMLQLKKANTFLSGQVRIFQQRFKESPPAPLPTGDPEDMFN